jgi:hypothetical protein
MGFVLFNAKIRYALHLPRNSSVVYSCSADGTIACFDLGQQKLLSQLAAPEIPYVIKVFQTNTSFFFFFKGYLNDRK